MSNNLFLFYLSRVVLKILGKQFWKLDQLWAIDLMFST